MLPSLGDTVVVVERKPFRGGFRRAASGPNSVHWLGDLGEDLSGPQVDGDRTS